MQPAAATFAAPDWPQDAWYAAAYDVEVGNRKLLARTVADKRLVLYRRTDGTAVALENACWHRLLPLDKGHIEGDEVVCGYHGLAFDGAGRCTFMPSQDTVNPAAKVRSYPVLERHRFVWVWTGDPAAADPDRVPDLHWNDDPAWAGDGRLIEVAMQLQARRGQPHGPHARDVRARRPASGTERWPRRRSRSPTVRAWSPSRGG